MAGRIRRPARRFAAYLRAVRDRRIDSRGRHPTHAGQPAASHRRPLSRDRPLRDGPDRCRCAAHAVLGNLRQPERRAARVPARRTGRGLPAAPSPLLRPGVLAHRALRPARRGTLGAARRSSPTTRRTHLVADLERLRRHLGIDAVAALRRLVGSTLALAYAEAHPSAASGSCCAEYFSRAPPRSTGSCTACATSFPEAWRAFSEFLPAGERDDLLAQLLSPADASGSGRAHARGARVGSLRRRVLEAAAVGRPAAEVRQRRLGARHRADRGALLRPPGVPRRRRTPRERRPDPPPALHDRPGPLRRHLPAGDRRRARPRVAGGRIHRRPGRRSLRFASPGSRRSWSRR